MNASNINDGYVRMDVARHLAHARAARSAYIRNSLRRLFGLGHAPTPGVFTQDSRWAREAEAHARAWLDATGAADARAPLQGRVAADEPGGAVLRWLGLDGKAHARG